MWKFLSESTPFEMIILTICLLIILAAISVAVVLVMKSLNIRSIKIKGAEITSDGTSDVSIIQHLEVRDYRHILAGAFDVIKDDIRNRVRKNGWLSRKDWTDYVQSAITNADVLLTRELDDHYYPSAKVERTELFDWNRYIWPDVHGMYQALYERMFDVVKIGYERINRKKSELESLQNDRVCEPKSTICPSMYKIIKLTTEILIDENLSIRESCMIEAERILSEIQQKYYSHYLTKYSEVTMKEAA